MHEAGNPNGCRRSRTGELSGFAGDLQSRWDRRLGAARCAVRGRRGADEPSASLDWSRQLGGAPGEESAHTWAGITDLMDIAGLERKGVPREAIARLGIRRIRTLTDTQVAAIDAGLLEGAGVFVSAPTSSGKSLIGELVALRHAGTGLCLYLVSHRALARQVHDIFKRWYAETPPPLLRAGILTGDDDSVQGEWSQFDVIVATYEKAYAALSHGGFRGVRLAAVIADEMQLVGESGRGPTVEHLLAKVRQLGRCGTAACQLVALSATVPNSAALADWLQLRHIVVSERVPPLYQELWFPGGRFVYDDPTATRRNEGGGDFQVDNSGPVIGPVIAELLREGHGPICVMATTKPNAAKYVTQITECLPVDESIPIGVVEDFRASSEDPDAEEDLTGALARGVAVHHADLTPDQRRVSEDAFAAGLAKVIVATPTLQAGVNLPIRTVVYPTLLRWAGDAGDQPIGIDQYVNGAGRAGRLGHHPCGRAIILMPTATGAKLWEPYVRGRLPEVESQLADRSTAFRLMHLLVGMPPQTREDVDALVGSTLWASEERRKDAAAVTRETREILRVASARETARCWHETSDGKLELSTIGSVVARSCLEPSLAMRVLDLVTCNINECGNGRLSTTDLLVALSGVPESADYLPYAAQKRSRWAVELRAALGSPVVNLNDDRRVTGIGHVLLAIGGKLDVPEWVLAQMRSHAGERSRMTEWLARLIECAATALEVAPSGTSVTARERLRVFVEQLRYQVTALAVPVAQLLAEEPVRNVPRPKKLRLARLALGELSRLVKASDEDLVRAVGKKQVAAVRAAVLAYLGGLTREQASRQLREARRDPGTYGLVEPILRQSGVAFEPAVRACLRDLGMEVELVSQEGSAALPDLRGTTSAGRPIQVECKTTLDLAGEIMRDEAIDILKKVDVNSKNLLATVGRPVFSFAAVERAVRLNSTDRPVHLITAGAVVECVLAHRLRGVAPQDLEALLLAPPIADGAWARESIRRLESTGLR